ncbi:hypothetical protein HPB52_018518 [Rhipicephalus sanguineus]|uniref:DDE-1 domain-containing protein n=1 Tax=Rhipicephalus sanguineus TaxID=34632 RepID=A0A9D4QBR0_RHISA|nr:hypothetical protein HPB52_018518 [Rhipicephalus sanguineus]
MERKQLDKKLSVLDAMHYIASAWDAVTPETITNSFRHCGFNRSGACSTSEAAVPVDDEPEFSSLELPGSFADYVGADDDVAVCSEVSLDDIIETVRPDTAGTSDEEEMDDAAEASASVLTYADVLCYVNHIRRFACARDEIGDLLPGPLQRWNAMLGEGADNDVRPSGSSRQESGVPACDQATTMQNLITSSALPVPAAGAGTVQQRQRGSHNLHTRITCPTKLLKHCGQCTNACLTLNCRLVAVATRHKMPLKAFTR